MSIPVHAADVPYLNTAQMVEVDRLMMEEYGIELIQMMESAGRSLAHLARVRFLDGDPRGKRVVVAAGTGGNGGGALVCARRLSNWGADLRVVLTRPDENFAPVPAHQLAILRRMGMTVVDAEEFAASSGEQIDLCLGQRIMWESFTWRISACRPRSMPSRASA
jgi:NAD(P)H-hydrate epimerase